MTEMLIPAKYQGDIDTLRYGHHGWHGFRHRLAEYADQAARDNAEADEEAHQ